MGDEQPAGRPLTPKGAERRAALVAAGGALFLESGTEGFTHRTVARRAGVPVSATTYYFDSLDDLLVESVVGLCAAWSDALSDALRRVPRRLSRAALARTVVGLTLVGPGTAHGETGEAGEADEGGGGGAGDRLAVAFYQRSVEAGRHPGLRPAVRELNQAFEDVVADLLRRTGLDGVVPPRLLLAVLDGAMVRALSEGEDPRSVAVADVRAFLRGR